MAGGQNLAGIVMFISDIHSLGLKLAQGLIVTEAYYWDLNDRTRAFGKRFFERIEEDADDEPGGDLQRHAALPQRGQGRRHQGNQGGAREDARPPVRDAFTDNGVLREDGRMVHGMFLLQVKKPEESKAPWDYYKVLAEVPGDQAFRPLKDGGCPLVK